MPPDRFIHLTELAGDLISVEQLQRMYVRYMWAGKECDGRDVLEVACGSGQGLPHLAKLAKTVTAGDLSIKALQTCQAIVRNDVGLCQFDALAIPFSDDSFDTIIIFEAIYYLPSFDQFLAEIRRVLRPLGKLLISTANPDLYDFHPSPNSVEYLGVLELHRRLKAAGFSAEVFGDTPVDEVSLRQRLFRPMKALASRWHLIPEHQAAKVWLKRVVFGRMVRMPGSVVEGMCKYANPRPLAPNRPDTRHKVLLCRATKGDK